MKHFTMGELLRSSTADAHGINNKCDISSASALKALAENVLDPARESIGVPIYVNSGYRSPQLNRLVGGTPNSQHTKGEAADITTGTKEGNKALFEYIRDNLPYDQLINEKDYSWVHVSYKKSGNRKEVLNL